MNETNGCNAEVHAQHSANRHPLNSNRHVIRREGRIKKSSASSWKSAKWWQVQWMSTSCSILFFWDFTTRHYLDLSALCLRFLHTLLLSLQSGESKLLHHCQICDMLRWVNLSSPSTQSRCWHWDSAFGKCLHWKSLLCIIVNSCQDPPPIHLYASLLLQSPFLSWWIFMPLFISLSVSATVKLSYQGCRGP